MLNVVEAGYRQVSARVDNKIGVLRLAGRRLRVDVANYPRRFLRQIFRCQAIGITRRAERMVCPRQPDAAVIIERDRRGPAVAPAGVERDLAPAAERHRVVSERHAVDSHALRVYHEYENVQVAIGTDELVAVQQTRVIILGAVQRLPAIARKVRQPDPEAGRTAAEHAAADIDVELPQLRAPRQT